MSDEKPTPGLVKVRVTVDGHEHNYQPVKKGTVIAVDEKTAAIMVAQQLGEKA